MSAHVISTFTEDFNISRNMPDTGSHINSFTKLCSDLNLYLFMYLDFRILRTTCYQRISIMEVL